MWSTNLKSLGVFTHIIGGIYSYHGKFYIPNTGTELLIPPRTNNNDVMTCNGNDVIMKSDNNDVVTMMSDNNDIVTMMSDNNDVVISKKQ